MTAKRSGSNFSSAEKKSSRRSAEPELAFADAARWSAWLSENHALSSGVALKIGKKGSGSPSITYAEALDVALAWGWIDGRKSPCDATAWLQRYTPRKTRSSWSKINRAKAEALIAAGKMKPSGLAQVEQARVNGRWDAAYDSARTSQVPDDLAAALAGSKRAAAFFQTIDSANRYAILYRVQTAGKPETRATRIAKFVEMLARGETIHPPRRKG